MLIAPGKEFCELGTIYNKPIIYIEERCVCIEKNDNDFI